MNISWLGNYSVKIQSSDLIALIDPNSSTTGLSPYRGKVDIISFTNPSDESMSNLSSQANEAMIISGPGEYSMSGFTVYAYGWQNDRNIEQSIQRWHIEDMVLLYVGALNKDLSDKELQDIQKSPIDILLLPIGGGKGLELSPALKLLRLIEPKIVIPIHYSTPGLKEKIDDVKKFADEMGVDPGQAESRLTMKAGKLPGEEMLTVILKP